VICAHCNQPIYEVTQHAGPDVLVHEKNGYVHCNADWEVHGGTVAMAKEVAAK
jgi:hypothetical protein